MWLFWSVLFILPPWSVAQQKNVESAASPATVVQNFKTALDRSDYAAICKLMAAEDGSGPLKVVHYERMQRSLEGLVNMWKGTPFQYAETTLDSKSDIPRSIVLVNILNLRQSVRFILLKFGSSWYIFDIEIYFK